jgi:plastocyanin
MPHDRRTTTLQNPSPDTRPQLSARSEHLKAPPVPNANPLIYTTGIKCPQILNKNAVCPFLPYCKQSSNRLCCVRPAFAFLSFPTRNFSFAPPRYPASRDLVNMLSPIEGDCFAVKCAAIRKIVILANVITFVATAGCNSQQTSSATAIPASTSQAPSAPAIPVDIINAGSISGTVTLVGAPPKPRLIYMVSEPMCERQHDGAVVSPEVVVGDGGALANTVVYVKSGLASQNFAPPKDPVKLSQKGCMYDPHVLALMVGQPLVVTNDDQTLHNVHAMPKINPSWNKGQAGGQQPIEQTFSQEELGIPVQCNIHPWMRSYVSVFNNPYFAVTPKSGKFELKNLPPGTYTIEAWQEKFGTVDQTVTLGPKESKSISFSFNAASSSGGQ